MKGGVLAGYHPALGGAAPLRFAAQPGSASMKNCIARAAAYEKEEKRVPRL